MKTLICLSVPLYAKGVFKISIQSCIQSFNITIIKLNTGLIYQAANNYMTLLPFALRSSSRFFCCIPAQVSYVGVPLSYIHLVNIP